MVKKPDLHDGLDWYLDAFWMLTGERPVGAFGGVGRIPFSAVDRWAARFGVEDLDAFERLHAMIEALDAEFIDFVARQPPPPRNPG